MSSGWNLEVLSVVCKLPIALTIMMALVKKAKSINTSTKISLG